MAAKVAGYTVDALFAAERVIVELDSWEFHQSRESFESDRERDAATLAADHVTIRLTWARMSGDPAAEAARLHQILRDRRARGGVAPLRDRRAGAV
jgi:very-short-patch-repair endonuclease